MSTPYMSAKELAKKFESLHPSPKEPVLGPIVCALKTGANPSYVVFPNGHTMHIVAHGILHSFQLDRKALEDLYAAINAQLSELDHHDKAMQQHCEQEATWHDAKNQFLSSRGLTDPLAKKEAGHSIEPTK
jgi:hypothetical protein